jgi:prepilin-type processing-associated H-X9-DG protein
MGLVMVNRLRDAKKAEQSLAKIENMAGNLIAQQGPDAKMRVTLRETKSGDVTVHFVGMPVFTPSWAVHGGNLYVGLYPQVVATAARNAARGGKSILDNPDFVAVRQRLLGAAGAGAKASALQFVDLPKTAPSSYQTWMMLSSFARMGDMAGVESPAMLFPPMDVLMQHLSPAASVSWTDDAGWHLRGVSPFPGSTVLGAETGGMMDVQSTALMASIMLPSLNRAREQANRVKSASNLRQMGQGIQMFANENKGKFPKDIGQIPATQDLQADVFVNPRKGSAMPPAEAMAGEAAAKWVRQNSDYVYVGAGRDYRMTADEVLAYEKPEGLSDGINVLFGDGHVEFLPTAQATPTIREGRKAGGPLVPFGGPRQRPPAPRNQGDRFAPRGAGGGI